MYPKTWVSFFQGHPVQRNTKLIHRGLKGCQRGLCEDQRDIQCLGTEAHDLLTSQYNRDQKTKSEINRF